MKTALHSVSYSGLWKGQASLSLEQFVAKAAKLGFDGVELMAKRPHASILDMDEARTKVVRSLLDENNIKCAAIAGYTNFTGGAEKGEVPFREMQIEHVGNLAKLAHNLGGNIVRIFTGYERLDTAYSVQWEWCVSSIKECAKRAAEYGVVIGIQNHHDIGVNVHQLKDLLLEIDEPNCRAMFDAWAPAMQGDDLKEVIKVIADLTVYTTVADYIRYQRYNYNCNLINYEKANSLVKAVPVGQGFIDYQKFLHALKNSGFDGYVAYEMCSPVRGGGSEKNLDYYAGEFLDYMKQF